MLVDAANLSRAAHSVTGSPFTCRTVTPGVVRMRPRPFGAPEAEQLTRTVAAHLLQNGYEVARNGAELTVTAPEPGPEVDDPRDEPEPLEWPEVAPRPEPPVEHPVRIAVDADCPGCGYPERSYDPATGVFACSSLNRQPCDYTSTTRDAEVSA